MTKLKLIVCAACALLIVYGAYRTYSYIDRRGYHRAAVEYQSRIDKMVADAASARASEIERQNAANSAAKTREAIRIAEMQASNLQLQSQIEELLREASKDPDAGRPSLGSSSVQRINKIR